jgi:hypothetical protein
MSTDADPTASQPDQEQPPIDVIEPDPTVPPRPEEEAADEIRAEDPATPQA